MPVRTIHGSLLSEIRLQQLKLESSLKREKELMDQLSVLNEQVKGIFEMELKQKWDALCVYLVLL